MNRQPGPIESIVYLVLAYLLAAIYTVTTMGYYYFAPDTPELRKRSVSLTVVGAIASTGVSTIFLVQASSPSGTPSFLPLWGAYIGFSAWTVSLLGRVWRARFLADIRRAKARNAAAAAKANADEARAQLHREQNWLRRRRAPRGDMTLTGIMAAIGISTLICLLLVQCLSTRYRVVPLDVGHHNWSNWEYIPLYIMLGFFMAILCPIIVWLLVGLRDAYNIASDLQFTVAITLLIIPIYFTWTSVPALEHQVDAICWLAVMLFSVHVVSVVRPVRRALRLRLERRLLSRSQFYRALENPTAFRRLEKLAEADFSLENCRFIQEYQALKERTETVKRQQMKREEQKRLKAEQTTAEQWGTIQAAHVAMQTALAMRALGLPGTVEFAPTSPQHYHMADDAARAEEVDTTKVALDWNLPRLSCIEIPTTTAATTAADVTTKPFATSSISPSAMQSRPISPISNTSSFISNNSHKSEMIELAQHVKLSTYQGSASILSSPTTPRITITKRTSSLAASRQFSTASARATRLAEAPAMPSLPVPAFCLSPPMDESTASANANLTPFATTTKVSPATTSIPLMPLSLSPTSTLHTTRSSRASSTMSDRISTPVTCTPSHMTIGPGSVFTERNEQMISFVNNGPLPDWLAEDYRQFYYVYLAEGALLEVNVDHGVRRRARDALTSGHIEPTIFDEAYHAVLDLLYRNTFPRYVNSLLHSDAEDELDMDTDEMATNDDNPEEELIAMAYNTSASERYSAMTKRQGAGGNPWDVVFSQHGNKSCSGRLKKASYLSHKKPLTPVARMNRWWRRQMDELAAWRDHHDSRRDHFA